MSEQHDVLKEAGIAPVRGLSVGELADIWRGLMHLPVYNAHVQAKSTEKPVPLSRAMAERRWPMFCHSMQDIVALPHLFELALAQKPAIESYFEEPAVLYSMNIFHTQPAPNVPQYLDTHGWHRDGDDRKQCVVFVYGTAVSQDDEGAHLYQIGSHLKGDDELGRDFRAPPENEVAHIHGPAGTAFLADTRGLHIGLRPQHRPRTLMWARWGVSQPPDSYGWDKLAPAPRASLGTRYPADPDLQRAIRFVAA